ncbi:hypothetical protein DYB25_013889, partial [Aphanomyces astaci]
RRDDFGRDRGSTTTPSSYAPRRPPNSFGGDDDNAFLAMRVADRKALKYNIWATFPSPPSPEPVVAKKKASAAARPRTPSPAPSSSSSSSEDRRRRKRRRRNKRKASSSKSSKSKKRQRSPSTSSSSSSSSSESDAKAADSPEPLPPQVQQSTEELDRFRVAVQGSKARQGNDDHDDDVVGPMPLPDTAASAASSVTYGRDLLPGEGAAIAQFVQKNMRIPRRGEVGWSGNEIEQLETAGYVNYIMYVMSGSRHQRMNAIRIRKENQVYSAEEKRALALINMEEKQQRENNVMAEFRDMLTEKLTKKHGALVVQDRSDINAMPKDA